MASLTHGSIQNLIIGGGGSTHSAQTDLLMANYTSGMQINGRISAVRRFFCLFVTFDLLFTCLFWTICVLVDGGTFFDAVLDQIVHYSMYSSIFDIVICSFSRFIFLITFYAIIHIDHWWSAAISTTLSCLFLIAKTLVYKWKMDTSYPFEVMLVLVSFFIAWTEAWLIDFRVIPQEARAKSILEVASGGYIDERIEAPRLDRVRDYLSQYTESVGNFYSPLQSPAESDDESCYRPPKRLTAQESEYVLCGEQALHQSWETLNSPGWNLEKTISHSDIIFSKKCTKGYKIYKLMAVVEARPEDLFKECLHNFEGIPKWNQSTIKCQLIQSVNHNTDITYQVAAESPGGIVSQRDFVSVRSWAKIMNSWITSSMSVTHPNMPVQKNMVRAENGPTCLVFGLIENNPERCAFQWLLDVDLKGWIPKYVLEQALIHAVGEFLGCIKTFAPILRDRLRDQRDQEPFRQSPRTVI